MPRDTCYIPLIIMAFWVSSLAAFGQGQARKYSNEFMFLGVGARGIGMGQTQVAIASDATSGYWNPANLMDAKRDHEFGLMHTEYFSGIGKYDFVGFSTKLDSLSRVGVTVIRFGVDDIPDTRFLYDANGALNYDNVRFFSASDYGILFSYAHQPRKIKHLTWGGNIKIIHRSVGKFANAWGFGLDFAMRYRKKGTSIGLVAKDFTGTFNAWTHNSELLHDAFAVTGNEIPESSTEVTLPRLMIGVAQKVNIGQSMYILASADLEATFDGQRNTLLASDLISFDPRFGLEVMVKNVVFIRFGANQFQELTTLDGGTTQSNRLSTGIGVKLKNIDLDYALADFGNQSLGLKSHVISISFGLDQK